MKPAYFVKEIQAYFGEYPEGQKKYISAYVQEFTEEYLDILFRELLRTGQSQFKCPPDIAAMEEKKFRTSLLLKEEETKRLPIVQEAIEPPKETLKIEEPMYDVQGLIDDLRKRLNIKRGYDYGDFRFYNEGNRVLQLEAGSNSGDRILNSKDTAN